MKKIVLILAAIVTVSSVMAQKNDTTIYNGCKAVSDTTRTIGDASILDSCPLFKNGRDDFNKFIDAHIRYSTPARATDKHKRLIVEMIIEKDGRVSHAKAIRSVSEEFNKEVINVINSSPRWKPGILRGHPVRVRYWTVVSYEPPAKS
ncbi:MAG: energy transducer TonB [Mucilaginibacter sp.]